MNKLAAIPLILSVLAAPTLSFAQSSTGLTRAQVVADLVRLEKAGYDPSSGDAYDYPTNIQAAEAKVAAEDAARVASNSTIDPGNSSPATTQSSGATTSGTSDAGQKSEVPMGSNHAKDDCVGPPGFCNPYFGN